MRRTDQSPTISSAAPTSIRVLLDSAGAGFRRTQTPEVQRPLAHWRLLVQVDPSGRPMGVGVGVGVDVGVGVAVGVAVAVAVAVAVLVWVTVGVGVLVGVKVTVAVLVEVPVGVGVP